MSRKYLLDFVTEECVAYIFGQAAVGTQSDIFENWDRDRWGFEIGLDDIKNILHKRAPFDKNGLFHKVSPAHYAAATNKFRLHVEKPMVVSHVLEKRRTPLEIASASIARVLVAKTEYKAAVQACLDAGIPEVDVNAFSSIGYSLASGCCDGMDPLA